MIWFLSTSLDDFPGPANQMQCFVHTVNLIARLIMKPFDAQKAKDIEEFNDAVHALANLAKGMKQDQEATEKDDEDGDEDGEDEVDALDHELDANLEPISLMLSKVCLHFIDSKRLNPKLINVVNVAVEICTCAQEFNDQAPPSMEQDTFHTCPS